MELELDDGADIRISFCYDSSTQNLNSHFCTAYGPLTLQQSREDSPTPKISQFSKIVATSSWLMRGVNTLRTVKAGLTS